MRENNELWRPAAFRRAWTLIEIVLALGIGGAVAATAATMSVHLQEVRRSVQKSLNVERSRNLVLDVFESDVMARLRGITPRLQSVSPSADDLAGVDIVCLTADVSANSLFARMLPARVSYTLDSSGGATGVRWLRKVRLLTEPPEAARTEILGEGLAASRIEYLIGNTWKARPETRNASEQPVRALRMVCVWDFGEDPRVRTVFLDEAAVAHE